MTPFSNEIYLPPPGISPRRRNAEEALSYLAHILRIYLQLKYTVSMPEKISICLNRGREESVGNDDVSTVCARKYEMVRDNNYFLFYLIV